MNNKPNWRYRLAAWLLGAPADELQALFPRDCPGDPTDARLMRRAIACVQVSACVNTWGDIRLNVLFRPNPISLDVDPRATSGALYAPVALLDTTLAFTDLIGYTITPARQVLQNAIDTIAPELARFTMKETP